MEQITQSKESAIKLSKDMENEPVSEDNSNKAKTKLSFGISRILDDSGKSSDEQNSGQDINSDDDDEYRQTESPDFKKQGSDVAGYHISSFPQCLQPLPYVPFGLYTMPSLTLPIPRPNPVVPVLSSYSFPGWMDLRRDRYSCKYMYIYFVLQTLYVWNATI